MWEKESAKKPSRSINTRSLSKATVLMSRHHGAMLMACKRREALEILGTVEGDLSATLCLAKSHGGHPRRAGGEGPGLRVALQGYDGRDIPMGGIS